MGWRRLGGAINLLIGTLLLVFAGILLCGFLTAAIVKGWFVWIVLAQLFVVAFAAVAIRVLMIGLFISDTGVKVRTLTSTLKFTWDAVLAVRSRKTVLATGNILWFLDARQVTFDLIDGQTIESPLLGAFPGTGRDTRSLVILSATRYDQVVARLRYMTSLHQLPTPGDRPVG
jgi:hypothetical protein